MEQNDQKELKDIIIYNPKNNIFIKKIDSFIYRWNIAKLV